MSQVCIRLSQTASGVTDDGRVDLARALLERVIQGPELDLIWETYQDEGEENNEATMDVDDEEVEAQKIADS